MSSYILKKNFKFFAFSLVIVLIGFILVDNLVVLNSISATNLEEYSRQKIGPELGEDENCDLVLDTKLDYSRILVFTSQNSYHVLAYRKGRISNFYNLESIASLSKKNFKKFTFTVQDSVHFYNYSLDLKEGQPYLEEVDKELAFDYSSIVLFTIATMGFLIVYLKNKEYERAGAYKKTME